MNKLGVNSLIEKMKQNKELALLVLIGLFSFVLLYNYINLKVPNRVPHNPDVSNALFFSRQVAKAMRDLFRPSQTATRILWHSSLNEKYNVSFFRPRHFAQVDINIYAPYSSPGFIFLLALARIIGLVNVVVPVSAVLGLFSIYILTNQLYGRTTAILAAVLLSIFPGYVLYANLQMDIIPSVVPFVISLFMLYKALTVAQSKHRYLVLAGILVALSISIRPQNAILLIGYGILILLARKSLTLRDITLGTTAFIITILPLLVINKVIYGGFFAIGQNINPATQRVGGTFTTLQALLSIPFNTQALYVAFKNYLLNYSPPVFGLGVAGLATALREEKEFTKRIFLVAFLAFCLTTFFFYGSQSRVSGFQFTMAQGSMARYFMVIYIFLVIYAALFLDHVNRRIGTKYMAMLLTVVTVTSYSFTFGGQAGSLPNLTNNIARWAKINQAIKTLPKDSIIFTKILDKFIFPDQMVALYFTKEDTIEHPKLGQAYPILDPEKDVIPVIQRLVEAKVPVYIASDSKNLAFMLRIRGFKLKSIKIETHMMWRIIQSPL